MTDELATKVQKYVIEKIENYYGTLVGRMNPGQSQFVKSLSEQRAFTSTHTTSAYFRELHTSNPLWVLPEPELREARRRKTSQITLDKLAATLHMLGTPPQDPLVEKIEQRYQDSPLNWQYPPQE